MKNKKTKEKTNIAWPDKSTFEISIVIPAKIIAEKRRAYLNKVAKTAKIKGFRPGKAPLAMVEKTIGENKIYENVIQQILPALYLEEIKKHQLKPIANPKFSLISAQKGQDWQVKAVAYEKPSFSLGKYKEAIKKINAKGKIWVPGKEEKGKEEDKKASKEARAQMIIQTLIKTIKLELPGGLVEDEVSKKLSLLIDQLSKAGITLESHLASLGKDIQQIKAEYRQQITNLLEIEFILEAIADEENITVDKKDLEKLFKTDEAVKNNQYMASHFLRQQKTIEYLMSL